MTITLPFFDEKDSRELVHRIERDRKPKEKQYRAKKAEIATDSHYVITCPDVADQLEGKRLW